MKRNFLIGLVSSLIGSIAVLILLGAVGTAGAQDRSDAGQVVNLSYSPAASISTTFTYQGQLKNANNPFTATCSLAFSLYNNLSAGNLIVGPITNTVSIVNGFFTTGLDFGSNVFNGDMRWLSISVNCGSGFTSLSPRQALTPAPMAFALPGLRTTQNMTSPNVIGGYSGNTIPITVSGGTIGGGGEYSATNNVLADFATVSGGAFNTAANSLANVGGGGFNAARGWGSTVGGGYFNGASGIGAVVPGGISNRAEVSVTFAAGCGADAAHEGSFVWADAESGLCPTFKSTGEDQFLVRATGGVGINTNDPANAALSVAGGSGWFQGLTTLTPAAGQGVAIGFSSDVGHIYAYDYAAGVPKNLILNNPGGKVGIGTTSPIDALDVNGYARVSYYKSGGDTQVCFNSGVGELSTCGSSLRYKDNVADLTLGLETLAKLRPVTFDWKSNGLHDLGFVAEEVNQIAPVLTTLNSDGQIEGVKYDRITAILVKGVQEQQAQIDAQQHQIDQLQAQVAQLQQTRSPEPQFNFFNLISVVALIGFGVMWLQQHKNRKASN